MALTIKDVAVFHRNVKTCDKCHRPRDNNHETLCPICLYEKERDE